MMFFKKQDKRNANREIIMITYIFVAMFIALIAYLAFFTAFRRDTYINNTYNNKRAELLSKKTISCRSAYLPISICVDNQ